MKALFVTFSFLVISSVSFAAKFDLCTCAVAGDTGRAVGILTGKSYVKNSDGSVSAQELELGRQYYSLGFHDPSVQQIALGLCKSELDTYVKAGVCPK